MNFIRKSVKALPEYSVPQEGFKVKLNQNESPYDIPADIKDTILKKLREIEWNRYPPGDSGKLKQKISEYTGFSTRGIVTGNGSNEIIQSIFHAICNAGDRVILVSPGFSIFNRIAKLNNLHIKEIPLLEDFSFDVKSMIKNAEDVRMTVIVNPNNPTGTTMETEDIEKIAESTPGAVLVDEAYFELYQKTAMNLLYEYPNIIITRTFSKALSLAGFRLGYLLANPEIAMEVEKAKLPFSVGQMQQIAGNILLDNVNLILKKADKIKQARENLYKKLMQFKDFNPVKSATNFILFKVINGDASEIYSKLKQRGVLIRYYPSGRLHNMLRITVGTPEENQLFMSSLQKIMEN